VADERRQAAAHAAVVGYGGCFFLKKNINDLKWKKLQT
jgi:hypothetical protein